MTRFYSSTTGGFYNSNRHTTIPLDAVAVSDEVWAQLLDDESNGKLIQDDGTGHPEAVEPPPPTNQEKIDLANLKILQILKTTAWTQASDETNINQLAWATYRQEVRDVILQAGFPDGIVWPTEPS